MYTTSTQTNDDSQTDFEDEHPEQCRQFSTTSLELCAKTENQKLCYELVRSPVVYHVENVVIFFTSFGILESVYAIFAYCFC